MVDTPDSYPDNIEDASNVYSYPDHPPLDQLSETMHSIENILNNLHFIDSKDDEMADDAIDQPVEKSSLLEIKINKEDKTISFDNFCLTVVDANDLDPNYGLIEVTKDSDIQGQISVSIFWNHNEFEKVVSIFESPDAIQQCQLLKNKVQSSIISIICDSSNVDSIDVRYISGLMNFEDHNFVCRWKSVPEKNIISDEEKFTELYGNTNCNHSNSYQNSVNIFNTCDPRKDIVFMNEVSKVRGLHVCENFELGIQKIVKVDENFYAQIATTTGIKVFKVDSDTPEDIYETENYVSLTEIEFDISNIDPIIPSRKNSNSLVKQIAVTISN